MNLSILIMDRKQETVASDYYEIQVECRNCDARLFAAIPKGTFADAVRRAYCLGCGCTGELRKVAP